MASGGSLISGIDGLDFDDLEVREVPLETLGRKGAEFQFPAPYFNRAEALVKSVTDQSPYYFQVALAVSAFFSGLFGCGTMRR